MKKNVKKLKKIDKELKKKLENLEKLKATKSKYKKTLEIAEEKQAKEIRKESRIQQLIDENSRILDTQRKSYMDALRVNAANIFRNLNDDFRIIYNNYRDDHHYIRMLTRCPGKIESNDSGILIKLWLSGTIQKHIIKKINILLIDISEKFNQHLEYGKKINFQLMTGIIKT